MHSTKPDADGLPPYKTWQQLSDYPALFEARQVAARPLPAQTADALPSKRAGYPMLDAAWTGAHLEQLSREPALRIQALETRLAELQAKGTAEPEDRPYFVPRDHDGWLTTEDAARYLRLGASSTVRSLVSRGEIRPEGKSGKHYMFRTSTLDAYVTRKPSAQTPLQGAQGTPRIQAPGSQRDERASRCEGRDRPVRQAADGRSRYPATASRPADAKAPVTVAEPIGPPDPYAVPSGYIPDRGRLRRLLAQHPQTTPQMP